MPWVVLLCVTVVFPFHTKCSFHVCPKTGILNILWRFGKSGDKWFRAMLCIEDLT